MKELWNDFLLLLYGMLSLLLVEPDIAFVTALLFSVLTVSAIYLFHTRRSCYILTLLFAALCWLNPSLYCFFPMVAYSMIQYKTWGSAALALAGYLAIYPEAPVSFLIPALGTMIAFSLQYYTDSFLTLESSYRKMRDDSTELTLLLKEKNQTLLEKQDYEIYTATLRERNRIAREIHDNVGHMLSRSILMLGALRTINQDSRIEEPLCQLEETLSSAMDSIRTSVHDLHDESVNLKETLENLIREYTFCPVALDYDMSPAIPREIKYSFISIAKEALSNVAKHSNATRVHFLLREHPALYQFVITDNGSASHALRSTGIGLHNMQERIELLGGSIQFHTEDGFRIFISVPKTSFSAGQMNRQTSRQENEVSE